MVFALNVETWRVYAAEQSIPLERSLSSFEEVQGFVGEVVESPWWRDRCPRVESVTAYDDGATSTIDNGQWHSSWAAPCHRVSSREWELHLHPQMRTELVVLHELAHCAVPRWTGNLPLLRRGKDLEFGETRGHGPLFTATLRALVEQFAGAQDPDLAAAYEHFEVAVADEATVEAARAQLPEVEGFVTKTFSTLGLLDVDTAQQSQGWVVPSWLWGEHLRQARRHWRRPLLSQQHLAEQISVVEPCTRRDISRLEHAEYRPTASRDLRVAMAAAAILGIDPLWARFGLGLVRWDCSFDLDELRLIAPEWTRLVEHLNALLHARPPRWALTGDR